MTKPKSWSIVRETNGSVHLIGGDREPIKKPNATNPLGNIQSATIPSDRDLEKFKKKAEKSDIVHFSCENGAISLRLNSHETIDGFSANFSGIKTSYNFVHKWNELTAGKSTQIPPEKSPVVPSTSASHAEPATPRKRPSSSGAAIACPGVLRYEQPSPTKKRRFIKDPIDEAIERSRKGVMELPISQLVPPPKQSRLLREADPTFLSNLKQRMVADPAAPGACPMAVLCKDMEEPENFNAKHKNVYTYEVLGGLHSLIAKTQLSVEHPENPFFKVAVADVYIGLSDEESLCLARRHNDNSHFVHKMTHRDLVEACRARLYALNNQELGEATPLTSDDWKKSCEVAILPKAISNTHKDNVLSQASMPKRTWDLAIQVMDMFEQSKLKGQKIKLSNLLQKPEFKQNYFAPIRTLPEDKQCSLLSKVISKQFNLADMQTQASRYKQEKALRNAFIRMVNVNSWEQAAEQFPLFATDEQLQRFMTIDIKKCIPKSFSDFCLRAKNSTCESEELSNSSTVTVNQASAVMIVSKPLELTGKAIKTVYPAFNGGQLVITNNVAKDKMESLAYTVKEVNAFLGCHLYVVAAMSDVDDYQQVQQIWQRAFGHSEVLFVANSSVKRASTTSYLTKCTSAVILGFFTPRDGVDKDLMCAHHHGKNLRLNFIEIGETRSLISHLIMNYCPAGGSILDVTDIQGEVASAAVNSRRNVLSVLPDEEAQQGVYKALSELQEEPETIEDN